RPRAELRPLRRAGRRREPVAAERHAGQDAGAGAAADAGRGAGGIGERPRVSGPRAPRTPRPLTRGRSPRRPGGPHVRTGPLLAPLRAGGCGLVTVCDLAIAASGAKFGYPEVRRGLVAAMVMPHLLRHVGERAARWLLLSGELIAAEEAHRLGLVNEVVAPDLLLPTADTWAGYLAQGGPKALTTTKDLLRRCSRQALPGE